MNSIYIFNIIMIGLAIGFFFGFAQAIYIDKKIEYNYIQLKMEIDEEYQKQHLIKMENT